MRNIEEQIMEVKRRREIYTDIKNLRKKILKGITTGISTLVLVFIVAFYIPVLEQTSRQTPIRQYGSMILSVPSVGYVLIAILFFILGVVVALLCRYYKEYREKEQTL